MKTTVLTIIILLFTMSCTVLVEGPTGCVSRETEIETCSYVDTWIALPAAVRDLIASRVDGYFSPTLERYDAYLYPREQRGVYDNIPCHVASDFNGDGYEDYALLFSMEQWEECCWYLTTRMIIVLSDYNGLTIGADVVLGTVTADYDVAVEEYWGLSLVEAGTYTVTAEYDNADVVESISLENDAVYLASLDPDEEALMYASGLDIYETSWIDGSLAKKRAAPKDGKSIADTLTYSPDTNRQRRF